MLNRPASFFCFEREEPQAAVQKHSPRRGKGNQPVGCVAN